MGRDARQNDCVDGCYDVVCRQRYSERPGTRRRGAARELDRAVAMEQRCADRVDNRGHPVLARQRAQGWQGITGIARSRRIFLQRAGRRVPGAADAARRDRRAHVLHPPSAASIVARRRADALDARLAIGSSSRRSSQEYPQLDRGAHDAQQRRSIFF